MNDNAPTSENNEDEVGDKNHNDADNIVFVGSKPLINYIKSIVVLVLKKNNDEIIIRSRGKFISKAVDVAEVSRRRTFENNKNLKIKDIQIGSEQFEKEGRKMNISTMDIILSVV